MYKLLDFHGKWTCDTWTLNIDGNQDLVLVSSEKLWFEFFPAEWELKAKELELRISNNSTNTNIIIALSDNKENLVGNSVSDEQRTEVRFNRIASTPEIGEFKDILEPDPLEVRVQELNDFAKYQDDNVVISFEYDLNRRDLYMKIIEEFGLDEITAGHEDVDLMIVLLNWMSDNFRHASSGLPDERNAISIIDYLKENPDGVNCRGLSIIFAEVLRLYGIPAKHITVCAPEANHPVHAVVHAYSSKLQQWILFDPTVKVYLTDEKGSFMNLYTLRKAVADGEPLFVNEDANYNGNFMMTIADYKQYIAPYLFRFYSATNFSFGSGEDETTQFMLIPVGFAGEVPRDTKSTFITTTSADAFFATPQ